MSRSYKIFTLCFVAWCVSWATYEMYMLVTLALGTNSANRLGVGWLVFSYCLHTAAFLLQTYFATSTIVRYLDRRKAAKELKGN